MPRSWKDALERLQARIADVAAELEREEREEREAETERERREAHDEVRALRAELAELRSELAGAREPGSEPEPDSEPEPEPDEPDEPVERRRTRPGRKAGMAYDWDVDDDGNVIDLSIARVYSGEDEPDEVELPEVVNE